MLKKILVAIGLGILPPVAALATPYFRPLDVHRAQPVLGALIAPEGLGESSAAGLLPLITHSPDDGCILPSIVCEDWSPLAIGGSINAGQATFDVGPLANVLPWMVALGDAAMPDGYQLAPWLKPSAGQALTFSAGPLWEYRQATDKGYFRVFTGLAFHFR